MVWVNLKPIGDPIREKNPYIIGVNSCNSSIHTYNKYYLINDKTKLIVK